MADLITVPLAHLLPMGEAVRLGASESREYKPGEDITIPRAAAEMLLNAGYLQANPRNPEHVARIMGRDGDGLPASPFPQD